VKLLVLDIEGTIFRTEIRLAGTSLDSTIWQAIANALGPAAVRAEVETHKRWEAKLYRSYLDWMKDTIAIHMKYGLSRETFVNLIASARYSDGVQEILPTVNKSEYEMLLVSGGFRELAARAQSDFGIHHALAACEYLFGEDGSLKGYNLLPCDFGGKIDFIKLMLREYGLGERDWIFVGDGANDVPIAREAPLSIGLNPHARLRQVVTHSIESFRDLRKFL
jgi:phosphoserine phosphatase